jgi:Zn-dependent protease with chaperone function
VQAVVTLQHVVLALVFVEDAAAGAADICAKFSAVCRRCLFLQAEVLQMEPPELYVRQNPNPNAYTLAITGRKPFIVVHTSLLELLTPPELQAVLAHGGQCG